MVELGLLVLAMVAVLAVLLTYRRSHVRDVTTPKQTQSIKRLWEYVEKASQQGRWQMVEKALLQILKNDHKNTAAYNRLGMLYVKQEQYEDAIACFDIASSLAPSVASLYNLGLVQFQSGNLQQAASALEKVTDLEPTPKRLLVLARVQQQLGNHKRVVEATKRVVDLDPTERNLEYLAESYEAAKQPKKAESVRQQIQEQNANQSRQFYRDNR